MISDSRRRLVSVTYTKGCLLLGMVPYTVADMAGLPTKSSSDGLEALFVTNL